MLEKLHSRFARLSIARQLSSTNYIQFTHLGTLPNFRIVKVPWTIKKSRFACNKGKQIFYFELQFLSFYKLTSASKKYISFPYSFSRLEHLHNNSSAVAHFASFELCEVRENHIKSKFLQAEITKHKFKPTIKKSAYGSIKSSTKQ